jgi:hypothetical protein
MNGHSAVERRRLLAAHLHDAGRWALCGILALSAAAKLLTPYQDAYVIPEPLYYLGGLVELGAAVLLHTKYRNHAMAVGVVLALIGITLAVAVPGRLCGCFGSLVPLEGSSHVLMSGIVGALACLSFRSDGPGAMKPGRSRPQTRRARNHGA